MPQNVVDADTFTATVQCQADGDAVSGANCLVPAQDLSDRTRWLYNRSADAKGGTIIVPMVVVDNVSSRFGWDDSGGNYGKIITQTDTTGVGGLLIPLPPRFNATFTGVTAIVHGDFYGVGPHAGLPGTMPAIEIFEVPLATGVDASVGSQSDTSGGVVAYEAVHSIACTFAAEPLDGTANYYALITGETGANAVNSAFHVLALTMTVVAA